MRWGKDAAVAPSDADEANVRKEEEREHNRNDMATSGHTRVLWEEMHRALAGRGESARKNRLILKQGEPDESQDKKERDYREGDALAPGGGKGHGVDQRPSG